jgi:hypothetical protein
MQRRLEEVQSEKERLHDDLIAAEIKLDRLRSSTIVAIQTKSGETEEANPDQLCPAHPKEVPQMLGHQLRQSATIGSLY